MTNQRLTPEQVHSIRTLHAGNVPVALIAKRYQISTDHLQDIVTGKTWRSVPDVELPALDPEDAAVLIADESGHPYEWQAILTSPATRRLCMRKALRNTDPTTDLHRRIEHAGQVLALRKD